VVDLQGRAEWRVTRFCQRQNLDAGRVHLDRQMKFRGPTAKFRRGKIGHSVAGLNFFQINVREKKGMIPQ
jgi:hypothetical protein